MMFAFYWSTKYSTQTCNLPQYRKNQYTQPQDADSHTKAYIQRWQNIPTDTQNSLQE